MQGMPRHQSKGRPCEHLVITCRDIHGCSMRVFDLVQDLSCAAQEIDEVVAYFGGAVLIPDMGSDRVEIGGTASSNVIRG